MFVTIKFLGKDIIINIKYIKFITRYRKNGLYVLYLDGFSRDTIVIDEEDYKKIEKIIGEKNEIRNKFITK